ncbi:porin family protein [Parapedobacter sp. DT-150]|uniref:porin family protein n=1 Tax=Parapedobacter sp. DT-150 TaxID=3396162 RepID=UPI003F1A8460
MRKLFLSTLLLTSLARLSVAQESPVKFGVKAGINLPTISLSGEALPDEYQDYLKSSASFYFGATADFFINANFSIQPGLTLSGKGYKLSEEEAGYAYHETWNVMYLEIPVNAVGRFDVGPGEVFVGAGPYYGFAVSGKSKWEEEYEGESDSGEEDIEFGSDDEADWKQGDFGLNLLAGYALTNGLNVHLGYGLGLSNLSNGTDVKMSNRVFSIGVGFSF